MNQPPKAEGMDPTFFLIGQLSAFSNRYQAIADTFFEVMSWKQCFLLICVNLCDEPPTINEVSELFGSSHQNVKQLLLKLSKNEFVELVPDVNDRRKQRVILTPKCYEFMAKNDAGSAQVMKLIFDSVDPSDLAITIKTINHLLDNVNEKLATADLSSYKHD